MSVTRGRERARCMNQARNRSPNLWEPTTRVQNNQHNLLARTARVFVGRLLVAMHLRGLAGAVQALEGDEEA